MDFFLQTVLIHYKPNFILFTHSDDEETCPTKNHLLQTKKKKNPSLGAHKTETISLLRTLFFMSKSSNFSVS